MMPSCLSALCLLTAFAASSLAARAAGPPVQVRARVIVDNDFGGDPDGLFQLAQQLLSPSMEVRAVIGSHHHPNGFYGDPGTPEFACERAAELLAVMGLTGKVPLLKGAGGRIGGEDKPVPTEAAKFIVREAMRDDVKTPLYVVCGAGLTDLASAWLMEPAIGRRLRLVWIGGPEYDGIAGPPPGARKLEYNLSIDLRAGQIVFNQSDIPIWQVPRDAYRQALVSRAELGHRMDDRGPLASHLLGRLDDLLARAKGALGEAYVLGDNPLVLLTALQSSWEVDPSSSHFVAMPAPRIGDDGLYQAQPAGRPIRVFTRLDNRLMFEDLYAKVAAFDRRTAEK